MHGVLTGSSKCLDGVDVQMMILAEVCDGMEDMNAEVAVRSGLNVESLQRKKDNGSSY